MSQTCSQQGSGEADNEALEIPFTISGVSRPYNINGFPMVIVMKIQVS